MNSFANKKLIFPVRQRAGLGFPLRQIAQKKPTGLSKNLSEKNAMKRRKLTSFTSVWL